MMHSGWLPLWNPFQFCGYPIYANSQSAIFYPGNILFLLMPVREAFVWSAALHLGLLGLFMWLLLRKWGLRKSSATYGAILISYCTWQVSWLQLPTFLCTFCWLPLILLALHFLAENPSVKNSVLLGLSLGMCLLGGHLQIAFYCLITAILYLGWLGGMKYKNHLHQILGWSLFALVLGLFLAAPQMLPSMELARQSHRATPPTSQGYAAYVAYAVNPNSLVTLFLPDFYGNPSRPDAPYFGQSLGGMYFNYAEGALYVGITSLILIGVGLTALRKRHGLAAFLGILAVIALLMAMGSVLDRLFYFLVPGFAQSGSPGRSLAMWAFAMAGLGAIGLEEVQDNVAGLMKKGGVALAAILALCGAAMAMGMPALNQAMNFATTHGGELIWDPQLTRQIALFMLSLLLFFGVTAKQLSLKYAPLLFVVILIADLAATGMNYNQSARNSTIYSETSALRYLAAHIGHDRILPLNTHGLSFLGPTGVLPPNGATVFGLRDVQGYDSLFPGRYKRLMDQLDGEDSSPPEVGNMVLVKRIPDQAWSITGAKWALSDTPLGLNGEIHLDNIYIDPLTGPGRIQVSSPEAQATWLQDDPTRVAFRIKTSSPCEVTLADEMYPGWLCLVDGQKTPISLAHNVYRRITIPAGNHLIQFRFEPFTLRLGMFLMMASLGVIAFLLSAEFAGRNTRIEQSNKQ